MLDHAKGPRRNRHRQAFQGPGLDSIGADACRQDGGAGTGEDRGENRLIGRQFDGNVQIAIRHAERVEYLDEGGSRSRATLS